MNRFTHSFHKEFLMSKSNNRRRNSQKSAALGAYFPEDLRQKLSEDLQLSGMAKRTHDGYIRAIRQLSDFAKCSPDQVTENHVRQFFLHLKNDRGFAYGSLRVALSGVKFFFTRTCKRDWDIFSMLKLQNITALPEVLTISQTHELIGQANTLRIYAYFWTVYSMGLRLNEALHLQTTDLQSQRGFAHIHRGKGAKDRYVPLPESTLKLLRAYWLTHHHDTWIFPAVSPGYCFDIHGKSKAERPMAETTVQGAMKQITKKLNFGKKISIHTLRHSYATHLLEANVGLKVIQKYMGHSSLQTTLVYLHLTEDAETNARDAIEGLFGKLPGDDDDPDALGCPARLK